jgi:aminotransferase
VAAALETLGTDYYQGLARDYRRRRDLLCGGLNQAGLRCTPPEGAYYVLTDFSALSDLPDDEFSFWLTREVGVAPVPGSSFYSEPDLGRTVVRFAFCKTENLLEEAVKRLAGTALQRPPSPSVARR